MPRKQGSVVAALIAIAAALVVIFSQRASKPTSPAPPPSAPAPAVVPDKAPQQTPDVTPNQAKEAPYDLSQIDAPQRQQVEETLSLIERGGPFPHKRDGIEFRNLERRLPQQRRGYYREYTVETPGASNRGARRVVQGSGGETYYTNDHYGHFVRIDRGGDANAGR